MAPWRTVAPRRVWPGPDGPSEARGMIEEHPGQSELAGEMLGQRLHTDGLRGVVAGVVHVQAQFFSLEVRMVIALPGDERVESRVRHLADQEGRASRHDRHAAGRRRAER